MKTRTVAGAVRVQEPRGCWRGGGVLAAGLTALYTTRMMVVTFWVLLAGCVAPAVAPLQSAFDLAEVEFINEQGTNAVNGSAFIRQRGGGVVTCAGNEVSLIPKGSYSTERMERLYGATTTPGYNQRPSSVVPPPVEGYLLALRSTTCDVDGRFEFPNIAAGYYFVVTEVSWSVGGYYGVPASQGGALMTPVAFAGSDEIKSIVLTP